MIKPSDNFDNSLRWARLITEIAAPWVWCVALPYVVALSHTDNIAAALGWATLVAIGAAVVPMGLILRGMKTGKVRSGHHVTTRIERYVPLVGALTSVGLVLAILVLAKAPPSMTAVAVVMLATVIVCLAITHWWKVSMHTAVGAGSAIVLTLLYGPPATPLWLILAMVAWSRVKLKHHTTPQVLAGTLVGATTGTLFLAIS